MFSRQFRIGFVALLLTLCAIPSNSWGQGQAPLKLSIDQLRSARQQMLKRPRRLIANNDGCDCLYFPKDEKPTVQSFLDRRTTELAGTHVDTIAYCTISSGFSHFTHNTRKGTLLSRQGADYGILPDMRNIALDLVEQGEDCLQAVTGFAHRHDMEVFWSMRMNDTHDVAHTPKRPYFLYPPLKEEHADWLVGNWARPTPYGRWSSVDYARREVRDLAFQYVEEVCQNYDVDGIEMDFFRHLCYFKSVASGGKANDDQRRQMTNLVRQVREMTETVGCQRGRPILVSVRVPDCTEYCRDMGFEIEQWLKEGLVDILITTGYFRLNPWSYSVQLGHKHGVAVYPCLSDSRVRGETRFRRSSLESYRGRAMNVWAAGADGVHVFNYFNPKAELWSDLGDPRKLETKDKLYFVTVRDGNPNRFLAGGAGYRSVPTLAPSRPTALSLSQPLHTTIHVGDDLRVAARRRAAAAVTLHIEVPLVRDPDQLCVEFNRRALDGVAQKASGWIDYPVPGDLVKRGANSITISLLQAPAKDQEWNLTYEGGQFPGKPWDRDPGSDRTTQEIVGGHLMIADRGTVSGDYLYYRRPWGIAAEETTIVEACVKVTSGKSSLIMANGMTGERLVLTPDHIRLYHHAELRYDMDTTDGFHVYRVQLRGQDLQIFVDGELRIDAPGKYTRRAGYPRNELAFGAANSSDLGEATWKYVRARTTSASVHDAVVQVNFPD